MMSSGEQERLRQFFGGYFHQDWLVEHGSVQNALSTFIREQGSREYATALGRSLSKFVEDHPNDKELERALYEEYGCQYYPLGKGESARSWLLSIVAILTGERSK